MSNQTTDEQSMPCRRHSWRNRGLVDRQVKWSPTSSSRTIQQFMKQQCANCPAIREVKA